MRARKKASQTTRTRPKKPPASVSVQFAGTVAIVLSLGASVSVIVHPNSAKDVCLVFGPILSALLTKLLGSDQTERRL